MTPDEAYKILTENSYTNTGKFYQSGSDLSLGSGKLYAGVRYPIYNPEDNLFDTLEGSVFILTHECDVSTENKRPFSDYLVFCPIIALEEFIADYKDHIQDESALKSFLSNLGSNNVSRVVFIPACGELRYGGLLYLNQISNTHKKVFESDAVRSFGATTAYGLSIIDISLTNHLLRPKSESLAFQY